MTAMRPMPVAQHDCNYEPIISCVSVHAYVWGWRALQAALPCKAEI